MEWNTDQTHKINKIKAMKSKRNSYNEDKNKVIKK